ncbi:hypothetical protein CL618_03615 [archaeon]|nr:hypothetical protein [archaeon]|tara:strand:- start:1893 stop:2240 length:348 start_codon:yes stop_codon:yes gene_type:complete
MGEIKKEHVEEAFRQMNYGFFIEDIQRGRLRSIRYDLETRGLDVNVSLGDGWTPLHYAAWHTPEPRKKQMIELLLQHGANKHQKNDRGKTPLDLVSSMSSASEIKPSLQTLALLT